MIPAHIVHGSSTDRTWSSTDRTWSTAQIVHGPAQTVHGQGGVVSVFGDSLNPETPKT